MKIIDKVKDIFTNKKANTQPIEKCYAINIVQDSDGFFTKYQNTSYLDAVFTAVAEPQVVFEKKATFLKSGVLKLYNSKTNEEIVDHKVLDFMRQPNPLQNIDSFLHTWLYGLDINGQSLIYINTSDVRDVYPFSMYVLPNKEIDLEFSNNIYSQIDSDGLIKKYNLNGKPLDKSKLLHFYNPDPKDYKKARGIMDMLVKKATLLEDASKLKQVVYSKKGAIGILSSNAKDGDGAIPLGTKEREIIQQQYKETYGIGKNQDQVILTDTALNWQPMTFPLSDFNLEETRLGDFLICIDAFGMDRNVFGFLQGSTFTNTKDGMKSVYNNTIIPLADRFCSEFNRFLKLNEKCLYLKFDFSHLDFLKADAKVEAETQQIKINNLISLITNNLIDETQQKIFMSNILK